MNIKVVLAIVGLVIGFAIGMFVVSTELQAIALPDDPKGIWLGLLVGAITVPVTCWFNELWEQTDTTFSFFVAGVILYLIMFATFRTFYGFLFVCLGAVAVAFGIGLMRKEEPTKVRAPVTMVTDGK